MGQAISRRIRAAIACAVTLAAPVCAIADTWSPGSLDYEFVEFASYVADHSEAGAKQPLRLEDPAGIVADSGGATMTTATESPDQATGDAAMLGEQPSFPAAPDFGGLIVRLMVGTVAVLAACVISLLVGKRWLMKNTSIVSKRANRMQLLDTLNLSRRCCVQLVHVEDRKLVVGIDASGVRSMLVLNDSFDKELGRFEEPLDTEADQVEPLSS